MPVSKLKNLVLLILLLANVLLLALLIPKQLEQRRQAEELRQSLSQLCARQNVTLKAHAVPDTVVLYPMELTDILQSRRSALTALLGDQVRVQETSVSSQRLSQDGTWENGAIRLKLKDSRTVSNLQRDCKKALQSMQFQYRDLTEPNRHSPGVYSLHAQQTVLGVPVFSKGLTVTYVNSAMTEISGDYYAGTLTKIDDTACMSAADAVVSFLSARVDLGWVGSAITAVEQGYLPTSFSASSIRLTPVWKLTTDTGSFYVNGLSGEVTAVE